MKVFCRAFADSLGTARASVHPSPRGDISSPREASKDRCSLGSGVFTIGPGNGGRPRLRSGHVLIHYPTVRLFRNSSAFKAAFSGLDPSRACGPDAVPNGRRYSRHAISEDHPRAMEAPCHWNDVLSSLSNRRTPTSPHLGCGSVTAHPSPLSPVNPPSLCRNGGGGSFLGPVLQRLHVSAPKLYLR
jgi:hypothetical protein